MVVSLIPNSEMVQWVSMDRCKLSLDLPKVVIAPPTDNHWLEIFTFQPYSIPELQRRFFKDFQGALCEEFIIGPLH